MYFKVRTNPNTQQQSVEIPAAAWVAVLVAIIGGVVTIATSLIIAFGVTKSQNEDDLKFKREVQSLEVKKFEFDEELKKQTQSLEMQKFQLELLQRALQGKNDIQRTQSLRILVDMKLLNIPRIDEFIKKPNTAPQWAPQSTGKALASPASLGGEPNASK